MVRILKKLPVVAMSKDLILRIVYAGTGGLPEKEMLAVKTINRDAAVTGMMVFVFGGIINYLFPLLPFLIAVILEGSAFYLIIFLNFKRRYNHAKMGMYLIHCLSATYFGSILGEAMPIEMIASFLFVYLIGSSCLVYSDWRSRNFFIFATVLLWVLVYLNRYFRLIQPAHFPEHVLPIVAGLCSTGMLVLMFFTAITLIKQSDRLTREAEEANKFKTDFVYVTSHELRNALTGVVGSARSLQSMEAKLSLLPDGVEVMKEVNTLYVGAKTMTDIINNQLDIAKIEAGQLHEPKISVFNILDVVDDCILLNHYAADTRGVQIRLRTDVPLLWINGDRTFMIKIVNNLLSNAVKFTAPGSDVWVSVRVIGQSLCFAFKNTAHLSADKAKLIFDEYHSERNEQFSGTGLGLSVVKNLVSLLNGSILVHTDDPEHTVFEVRVPYQRARVVVHNPEKPQQVFFPGLKVIVVDDDEMCEAVMKKILKGAQIEVESFNRVAEVLKVLGSFEPDIIISDWNMREMGGKLLIQYLKDEHFDIPVIVASGGLSAKEQAEMLEAGAAAIVRKPIIESELYLTISDCMRQYHLIS